MPTLDDGTQVDPKVVSVMKVIREMEGGNYDDRTGDNGSSAGAFQWNNDNKPLKEGELPTHWKNGAAKYLGDPNAPMTKANQNKLAYNQIKAYKDQGYTPDEIDALWNGAHKDPSTGKMVHNNPLRASRFESALQNQIQQQQLGFNPKPYSNPNVPYLSNPGSQPPPQQPQQQPFNLSPDVNKIGSELGNNLSGRLNTISNAAMLGSQGGAGNVASGVLQGVGAVAGGIGDVTNAALETVPGVQAFEQGIGNVLGSLAGTPQGQGVVQAAQNFSKANPVLAGNLGAAVNIASVFPIFKGLSLVKGAIADTATSAFKSKLEGIAGNELSNSLSTKASESLAKAQSRGLNPLGTLISDGKNLPDVIERPSGGYEYSSRSAASNIQSSLSQDEAHLQSLLSQHVQQKGMLVSLDSARKQALKDIAREYPLSGNYTAAVKATNEYFDSVEASSGNRKFIDLNEFNGIKRDVRGAVNFDNLGTQRSNIRFTIGQSLMNQIEDIAKQSGIKGVKDINKIMSEKLEALKLLKSLDGRSIPLSRTGKILREGGADVAGAVGETAGNAFGIPFAGTLAGRGLYKLVPGKTPGFASRMLRNASTRSKGSSGVKGLLKIGRGVGQQALVKPPQAQ